MQAYNHFYKQLKRLVNKHYKIQLIKGLIYMLVFSAITMLVFFLIVYLFPISYIDRWIIIILFCLIALFSFLYFFTKPVIQYITFILHPSTKKIGSILKIYAPEVHDKSINILYLKDLEKSVYSLSLVQAAINQKIQELNTFSFSKHISIFKFVKRYLLLLGSLIFIYSLFLVVKPQVIYQGSNAIFSLKPPINNNAPYFLTAENSKYQVVVGDSLTIKVKVKGSQLPANVYIDNGISRFAMQWEKKDYLYYTFRSVLSSDTYRLKSGLNWFAGFSIEVLPRPHLKLMKAEIVPPLYTGLKKKSYNNFVNLEVPQGSQVKWQFLTQDIEWIYMIFNNKSDTLKIFSDPPMAQKQIFQDDHYRIVLGNSHKETEILNDYSLSVIADKHPSILVLNDTQTTDNQYLNYFVDIQDDYGFSQLNYRYYSYFGTREMPDLSTFKSLNIPIDTQDNILNKTIKISKKDIGLTSGAQVVCYFEIYDNDAINQPKKSISNLINSYLPTEKDKIEVYQQSAKNIYSQATLLMQSIDEFESKLQTVKRETLQKKRLEFADIQKFKQLLDHHKKNLSALKKLKKEIKKKEKASSQIAKQRSATHEKMIDEMIKNLQDEALLEKLKELSALINKTKRPLDINQFNDLEKKSKGLSSNLKRQLKLLKKSIFEEKLKQAISSLDEIQKAQEKLSEQKPSLKNLPQEQTEDMEKSQKEIEENFKNTQEEFKQLAEQKEEYNPNSNFKLPEEELKEISDLFKEIEEKMKAMKKEKTSEDKQPSDNKNDKSADKKKTSSNVEQSQKELVEKLKKLKKQLEENFKQDQLKQTQINKKQLKEVLDGYLNVSFKQEDIYQEFVEKKYKNHKITVLKEKAIKDNLLAIQDTLFSLASKIPELNSSILKHAKESNRQVENAIRFIEQRNFPKSTQQQRYALTSLNELNLLLSSINIIEQFDFNPAQQNQDQMEQIQQMKSMQEQLIQQMKDAMKNQSKKESQGEREARLKAQMAMQQQLVKQMMESMEEASKKQSGGKQGNGANQEVSKEKTDKEGKNHGDENKIKKDIMKAMGDEEKELFFKELNQQSIKRQEKILSKMLDFEKAVRRREQSKEFESKSADEITQDLYEPFKKYIQKKNKEIELLSTSPIYLKPFFKRQNKSYLKSIVN